MFCDRTAIGSCKSQKLHQNKSYIWYPDKITVFIYIYSKFFLSLKKSSIINVLIYIFILLNLINGTSLSVKYIFRSTVAKCKTETIMHRLNTYVLWIDDCSETYWWSMTVRKRIDDRWLFGNVSMINDWLQLFMYDIVINKKYINHKNIYIILTN